MPHPDSPDLDPALLGLYVDEAIGRAIAIVAALTVRATPDDADVRWAAEAAHSLKGLTMQAGDAALAAEVHAIESQLEEIHAAPVAERGPATEAAVERVRAVERALAGRAAPAAREVDLRQVADAARDEALRVADRRGVPVAVEVVVPAEARVPRRVAGVLVDVLGHLARNAVVHGTPDGGTLRIVVDVGPESLTVVMADHGDRARINAVRRPDMASGRGVGLRAAQGRLAALGGELAISPGPWGGTSVTVRIPREAPDPPRPPVQ
jgi:chemotaxis protein histidine kinase CheA